MRHSHLKGALLAAAVAGFGSGAMASPVAGVIPGGTAINDAAVAWGLGSVAGWYGADLYLIGGPSDIQVTYLGKEAGYTNTFTLSGGSGALASVSYDTTMGDGFPTGPGGAGHAQATVTNVASSLLSFLFSTTGTDGAGSVANGSNVQPSANVNFFVSFDLNDSDATDGVQSSGNTVWLFLDDFGAGNDDNHDDMVIRLTAVTGSFVAPVPVPAGGLLLLGGLAGLAALKRRRRAA